MNVELAERAIRLAKANPEKFDMDSWVVGMYDGRTKDSQEFVPPCGTTACYAGWVSFQAAPVGSKVIGAMVKVPGQEYGVHVETYARQALDITEDQSDALFYLDTLEQVEKAVRYLADNPDAGEWTIREQAGQAQFASDES